MHAANRPTRKIGAAMPRSSDGISQAIAGTSTTSATMNAGRTYQRGWSKVRMKLTR
jgi:hypothetical protein